MASSGVMPISALRSKTGDLLRRRLIAPVSVALPLSSAYWIVAPKAAADLPKITTFRNWLLAEAADDTQRVGELAR
jgi:LysR family transcriptional regulator, glycine cleavage system transcriptional activator